MSRMKGELLMLSKIAKTESLSLELHPLGTDKGSPHTYLHMFYQPIFDVIGSPREIFEIGIQHKASLALWKIAFQNCQVSGCDIDIDQPTHPLAAKLINEGKISIAEMNPYLEHSQIPDDMHLIIDDGPHSISSQIKALEFRRHLAADGILIIEDVGDLGGPYFCFPILLRSLPRNERKNCLIIDLTHSGRWDDAIFMYVPDSKLLKLLKSALSENVSSTPKIYVTHAILLLKRNLSATRSAFGKYSRLLRKH